MESQKKKKKDEMPHYIQIIFTRIFQNDDFVKLEKKNNKNKEE